MSTCRSCEAEVVFVKSAATGRSMILDAKPAKGVVLTDSNGQLELLEPWARAAVVDVYTDHHVTCPDAASWRGRTRSPSP